MRKNFLLVFAFILFSQGCATFQPSIPEGYTGPRATVKDSVLKHSASKADFFYLDKVDGRDIETSLTATFQHNYGGGLTMTPVVIRNDVPAQNIRVEIVGRTYHAAPIQSFTNTEYRVAGEVDFAPEAGRVYTVKGILGEKYSAVWIETEDGKSASRKVEIHGSAELGILEK